MFHQKTAFKREVHAAIPKSLSPAIRELYGCHKFLDGIVEMEGFGRGTFLEAAEVRGMEPVLFLDDFGFCRNVHFHKLGEWFHNPKGSTFDASGCVGIHAMTTKWRERAPVLHWSSYMKLIKEAGLSPYFHGTMEDGKRMELVYPDAKGLCPEEHWRFGKDGILETIANLGKCAFVIGVGTWSAPVAALQGVPALDLFDAEPWQFFSPLVRQMIGNPVHYLQDSVAGVPPSELFRQAMPRMRELARNLYGF